MCICLGFHAVRGLRVHCETAPHSDRPEKLRAFFGGQQLTLETSCLRRGRSPLLLSVLAGRAESGLQACRRAGVKLLSSAAPTQSSANLAPNDNLTNLLMSFYFSERRRQMQFKILGTGRTFQWLGTSGVILRKSDPSRELH